MGHSSRRVALWALATGSATAQGVVKIGVLNDMSGVYSDDQGRARYSPPRWRSRILDGSVGGRKVEVISGDHQKQDRHRRPDRRGWLDNEGVGMIVDMANSATRSRWRHRRDPTR